MARPARSFPTLLLGLLLLVTTGAGASDFQVSPVRVDVGDRVRSALLTVRNQGQEPLRLQVTAFAWDQDSRGEQRLTATTDVSFFPSLLSLEAGEVRNIRVGVAGAPGATERTYRLIIEQLPPLVRGGSSPPGIRVLTRMSIPVFMAPVRGAGIGGIRAPCLKAGAVAFSVYNKGTAHFLVQSVHVRGLDAAGAVVMERQLPGWYVLAGGRRDYTLDLTAPLVRQIRRITVDARTDVSNLSGSFDVAAGVCSS
ncbi:fimbrial biogenesis chaperone [Corallococcus caeni]|uniref:fimbrial biogenesis chaperone n=1 Tax=Corallococcus caeni TaxID=3082388 RepID=UPI0030C68D86